MEQSLKPIKHLNLLSQVLTFNTISEKHIIKLQSCLRCVYSSVRQTVRLKLYSYHRCSTKSNAIWSSMVFGNSSEILIQTCYCHDDGLKHSKNALELDGFFRYNATCNAGTFNRSQITRSLVRCKFCWPDSSHRWSHYFMKKRFLLVFRRTRNHQQIPGIFLRE